MDLNDFERISRIKHVELQVLTHWKYLLLNALSFLRTTFNEVLHIQVKYDILMLLMQHQFVKLVFCLNFKNIYFSFIEIRRVKHTNLLN